jgi:hypothetical protein
MIDNGDLLLRPSKRSNPKPQFCDISPDKCPLFVESLCYAKQNLSVHVQNKVVGRFFVPRRDVQRHVRHNVWRNAPFRPQLRHNAATKFTNTSARFIPFQRSTGIGNVRERFAPPQKVYRQRRRRHKSDSNKNHAAAAATARSAE